MATLMVHTGVDKLLALADANLLLTDDVLTFDDGCLQVHKHLTRLRQLSQRKIVFVVPAYTDLPGPCKCTPGVYYQDDRVFNNAKPFMDRHMLRELLANGIELGMHSFAHMPVLTHGTTPQRRHWRLATMFGNNSKRLTMAAKMFGTTSALAEPGFVFTNDGQPCKRTVVEFAKFVYDDTRQCAAWFANVFDYVPTTYAAPFNRWSPELTAAVTAVGVTERFGSERLDVDDNYEEIVNARRN